MTPLLPSSPFKAQTTMPRSNASERYNQSWQVFSRESMGSENEQFGRNKQLQT